MSQSSLFSTYERSNKIKHIVESLAIPQNKIHCKGLSGSVVSIVIQSVFKKAEQPFLLVFNEKEEAAYYLNDLEQMLGQNDVLFYPSS
ncbi:MAG TPA: hypothetical protein PKH91_03720, partial [Flavobacterium sp.]|nr:hypothetical protein [Flavobacterium sp.]